jgi:hypothetical protein
LYFVTVGFKNLGSAYLEFMFVDVLVCWFERVNYVGVSVICVGFCFLELVVSHEEGSWMLSNVVFCFEYLCQWKRVLQMPLI